MSSSKRYIIVTFLHVMKEAKGALLFSYFRGIGGFCQGFWPIDGWRKRDYHSVESEELRVESGEWRMNLEYERMVNIWTALTF